MWLEIEALTPVDIGTGDLLGPLEYAISGSRVGVADLGRLFRRDPARAEAIGQQLAGTSPAALRSLSLERLLTPKELADEAIWRYRLSGSEETLAALARARTQEHELRLAMKTPDGRAYLPGTAIKGALRTALIFAWSAASPDWARGLLNLRDHRAANSQAQSVFYSPGQRDPNHDVLRALMIGDTDGASPAEALQIVQERVLSAKIRADRSRGEGSDGYKQFLVFLEGLAPGTKLAASVRILSDLLDVRRSEVLGWTPAQRALNAQALCDAANRMTAEVCQWELEYFGLVQGHDCTAVVEFYRRLLAKTQAAPPGTAYLSVGRGAGWHKLTPGILVARHLSQSEFVEFRKRYGLAAVEDFRLQRDPRLARFDRRDFVFPKSRKVVAEAERAVAPLGWVQLAFREGERPTRASCDWLASKMPPHEREGDSVEAQRPQVPSQSPPVPRRDPHVVEAEALIRSLKAHEAKGRFQAVAAAISKCPVEDRGALMELFRKRQEELGLRAKDIRAAMETLAQRLKPPDQAGQA